jgi:hypothetical protein
MIDEDSEIKQKQDLLQKEILDKHYDQQLFVNFCLSKKENGDDLNIWSLEELTKIVQEFISIQENEEKNENKDKKTNEQDPNEVGKESLENMEKMDVNENHKKFKEKVIDCRKLEKNDLNGQKITIQITSSKVIEAGVFGQSYTVYDINTLPFNWTVQRRYSDFDTLRKLLIKYYPGFNVPPLPNKKMGNKRFDKKFIKKRMKFLQLFINSVVENESFKANEFILAFLSYDDRNKFDAKMKEYSSLTPSEYVEEYKTLDGKAIISHDEGNEKYFLNINKYFKLQTQILEKLNFNLKLFYNNMNAAAENLNDVQKNFDILHLLNTKVLMKQTITKTYEELGHFYKNWRKILLKQNEISKNLVKDFFKFINLEGQSYSELIDRREELKQKYTAEVFRVNAKKEKIFNSKDINKFELNPDDNTVDKDKLIKDKTYAFEKMCFKDTRELNFISNQLGYANKMNIYELKKMINIYCKRFIENFLNFDKEFYPSINDFLNTWTNMEVFVQSSYAHLQLSEAEKNKSE